MRNFLVLLFCFLLAGCATMSLSKIASYNKDNLEKLSSGMTEEEALKVMGRKKLRSGLWSFYVTVNNPYRSEALETKNGRKIKILYYFTELIKEASTTWEVYTIKNNELTPLIFEEGKLIGIGEDSLNTTLAE